MIPRVRLAAEEVAHSELRGGARAILVLGCWTSGRGRALLRYLAGVGGTAPEGHLERVVLCPKEALRQLLLYGLVELRGGVVALRDRGLDVLGALPAPGPTAPAPSETLRRLAVRGRAQPPRDPAEMAMRGCA